LKKYKPSLSNLTTGLDGYKNMFDYRALIKVYKTVENIVEPFKPFQLSFLSAIP